MPFNREVARVKGSVQDLLHVLADGEPVVLAVAGNQFINVSVVHVDFALCGGNLSAPDATSVGDLSLSASLLNPTLLLGALEGLLGLGVLRLVSLGAAERPLQQVRRRGFEVRPLRGGDGNREWPEIEWRNGRRTPHRGEADAWIPLQGRPKQGLQVGYSLLDGSSLGSGLIVPGSRLRRDARLFGIFLALFPLLLRGALCRGPLPV